jgi:phage gp36-like protein
VRKRYEDAISFLKLVASIKQFLIQNEITEEVKVATKSPSTAPIGTTYTGGVFGDDVLGKMPSM